MVDFLNCHERAAIGRVQYGRLQYDSFSMLRLIHRPVSFCEDVVDLSFKLSWE